MYRVLSNEVLKHPQWIIVRDDPNGLPVMERGPYNDERVAHMHCDSLNREWRHGRLNKSSGSPILDALRQFVGLCLIPVGRLH